MKFTHQQSYEHRPAGLVRAKALNLPSDVIAPNRWFLALHEFTYTDGTKHYWLSAPYGGSVDITAEEAEMFAEGLACPVPALMHHIW